MVEDEAEVDGQVEVDAEDIALDGGAEVLELIPANKPRETRLPGQQVLNGLRVLIGDANRLLVAVPGHERHIKQGESGISGMPTHLRPKPTPNII